MNLQKDEQAVLTLRGLYQRYGYAPYKMSRWEEYDLYVRNKDFLVSDQVITFSDRSGRLLALKPDVTLSIIKNAPNSGEQVQKLYYLPVYLQLLLAEFVIDGLRMASMNTPDMLTNSLSVVGGLILGEFAVDVGWLIPEVILYMAFVAIANFTQTSFELGYALKFMRILLLTLTAFFNVWGFVIGVLLILVLIATNRTANGSRSYLYPLIPFSGKAMLSLLVRRKKRR